MKVGGRRVRGRLGRRGRERWRRICGGGKRRRGKGRRKKGGRRWGFSGDALYV